MEPTIMAKCIYFCSISPVLQEEGPGFMSRQIFEGVLLLLENEYQGFLLG
jgi:hypothetical protein